MSELVDAKAFDLVPPAWDGRASALLLHGFTGTPYEMRPVAEALHARGMRCLGPVMAGHDETHVELASIRYPEWIAAARDHYEALREKSEQVFIAGMSMGGLVTLALAAEVGPTAIAVMGVPLELSRSIRWRVPWAKYVRPYYPKTEGPDIQEPGARDRHPSLDTIPLTCTHEIIKLQKHVRGVLSKINAPTFVGHGALDVTANPRDARRVLGTINAGDRALFIGERSGHVISVDYDGVPCANAISEFFARQLSDG